MDLNHVIDFEEGHSYIQIGFKDGVGCVPERFHVVHVHRDPDRSRTPQILYRIYSHRKGWRYFVQSAYLLTGEVDRATEYFKEQKAKK